MFMTLNSKGGNMLMQLYFLNEVILILCFTLSICMHNILLTVPVYAKGTRQFIFIAYNSRRSILHVFITFKSWSPYNHLMWNILPLLVPRQFRHWSGFCRGPSVPHVTSPFYKRYIVATCLHKTTASSTRRKLLLDEQHGWLNALLTYYRDCNQFL